ncbi:Peroxisomal membrane protein PMP27 [Borealophlyctis nickersoniae]|nr:Peroxisomal membrane protein PMP27 [Borealophlyctis nickersoniae]
MSMIVSPQVTDKTVKFLSTTVGRDRINRFVQYFTRYLIWHKQRNGAEKGTIERLQKLMVAVAQTRKLMRVGRQLEFFRGIQKAQTVRDDVVRLTTYIKSIFLSLWLVHDSIQWAHTAGVVALPNIKDLVRRGQKCWLIALIASSIGNMHRLRMNSLRLQHEGKLLRAARSKGVPDAEAEKVVKTLKTERRKIMTSTLQDGLDLLLPASGLEYVNIESGIVGLIGAFTSIMGGYTHWNSL